MCQTECQAKREQQKLAMKLKLKFGDENEERGLTEQIDVKTRSKMANRKESIQSEKKSEKTKRVTA